jgi:DnaJ-domain-containing protein 1
MTGTETGAVVLFGAIGFGGVWYLLGLFGQAKPAIAKQTCGNTEVSPERRAEWYEVLGVPESADWQTIKAAYLTDISRYHPDKFAALDAEFNEIALRRARAINDAFEVAKRLRKQK